MERWVRQVTYYVMYVSTCKLIQVLTDTHPSNVQPHDLVLLLCHANLCAESANNCSSSIPDSKSS